MSAKTHLAISVLIGALFSVTSASAFGKKPSSPTPAPSPAPTADPTTGPNGNLGPQDVAVVLLDYPGTPDAALKPDPSFLNEVFMGKIGDVSVSDFFSKASEGQVAFRNFKIFGPYHLSESIYCDQEEKLWKLGVQAADAEIDFTQYKRIVFFIPRPLVSSSCDIYGAIAAARAELNCIDTSTGEGTQCLNFAWIGWQPQMQGLSAADLAYLDQLKQKGYPDSYIAEQRDHDYSIAKYYVTRLVTHEMLHGWNLMHNNTYNDDFRDVVPAVNQEVARAEYADFYGIMSSAGTGNPVGWMTGAQLVRLGWLAPDEWANVTADGEFEIAPLAYGEKGLKVLRIPRVRAGGNDPGDDLWIEYREFLSAYDSIPFWPTGDVQKRRMGVVVHETSKKLSDGETVLLKFNPPADLLSADYRMPQSWTDPYTGMTLQLVSESPQTARIRVSFAK